MKQLGKVLKIFKLKHGKTILLCKFKYFSQVFDQIQWLYLTLCMTKFYSTLINNCSCYKLIKFMNTMHFFFDYEMIDLN